MSYGIIENQMNENKSYRFVEIVSIWCEKKILLALNTHESFQLLAGSKKKTAVAKKNNSKYPKTVMSSEFRDSFA